MRLSRINTPQTACDGRDCEEQENAMGVVVPIRKAKDPMMISQDELAEFYELQQYYLDAQSAYLSKMAKIVERLNNNAHQEPGRYSIERNMR
jgi:hypothetical protein